MKKSNKNRSILPFLIILIVIFLTLLPQSVIGQSGRLEIKIIDRETNEIIPARVEIRDSRGEYYIAGDAIPVGGDCDMSDEGANHLIDLESTLASFTKKVDNPYTNSTQFYSTGNSIVDFPNGKLFIRVFKGPEYKIYEDTLEIHTNKTTKHEIGLSRWINMQEHGWYSSDDHLHIPRPVKELDPYIIKMMQAEDIHVGNLLQMGKVANFKIARQHSHGSESYYQEGKYILAAGQENPRTHFLGHTITLGAKETINFPEKYLIYRLVWQEAVNQGAINGFAHGYAPEGTIVAPHNGLAIILPHNLMHFIEVLQFNRSDYKIWYDILNLGFRVTPTAGTDFPCADQNMPGHERFYTKVEGIFNYENWLTGVEKGKTFVTTGPMVEFTINGQDIGSEIKVDTTSTLQISGSVKFDTEREHLEFIEVIQNGEIIYRLPGVAGTSSIDFSFNHIINETSWFALRGYGSKKLENTWRYPGHFTTFKPSTNVHSAPIYVTISNTNNRRRSKVAKEWLLRLKSMETMLSEDNIEYLASQLESPNFDAVPREVLIENRPELLKEIQEAKSFFEDLSRDNK